MKLLYGHSNYKIRLLQSRHVGPNIANFIPADIAGVHSTGFKRLNGPLDWEFNSLAAGLCATGAWERLIFNKQAISIRCTFPMDVWMFET